MDKGHTSHTVVIEWVNLVMKVGPVLLTRFPKKQELEKDVQNEILFIHQHVILQKGFWSCSFN